MTDVEISLRGMLRHTARDVDRLRAENERLRAALSPFAGIKADDGDDFSKWPDQVIIKCEVTVREIKDARAALAQPAPEQEKSA